MAVPRVFGFMIICATIQSLQGFDASKWTFEDKSRWFEKYKRSLGIADDLTYAEYLRSLESEDLADSLARGFLDCESDPLFWGSIDKCVDLLEDMSERILGEITEFVFIKGPWR
jgi:hypothetical protein